VTNLAERDKDESARKACLDIIAMARQAAAPAGGEASPEDPEPLTMDPEKHAKILAILAGRQEDEEETGEDC